MHNVDLSVHAKASASHDDGVGLFGLFVFSGLIGHIAATRG